MLDTFYSSYHIAGLLFSLLVLGVWLNLRHLPSLFIEVPKEHWKLLAALFLGALAVRVFIVPHAPNVFYDEYDHIEVARNLSEAGLLSHCDFFLDGRCLSSRISRWPPGYHFLLSLVFEVFGTGESAAYLFNACLGAAAVVLIFLTVFMIVRDSVISLTAALLAAFLPLHMRFSGGASPEITSSTFVIFCVLSAFIFLKRESRSTFFLLVSAVAFTLLIRPENNLLLPVLAMILFKRRGSKHIVENWPMLLLLAPSLAYLPRVWAYNHSYRLSPEHPALVLFRVNTLYWLGNRSIPVLCSLAGILGVFHAARKKAGFLFWALLWPVLFGLCYTFVQRAEIASSDSERLHLQFFFPVILLAASGLHGAFAWLKERVRGGYWALAILAVPLSLNFAQRFPYVFEDISDPALRSQHELFLAGKQFDPSCVFVTFSPPSLITRLDRSAVHIRHVLNAGVYAAHLKDRCLVLVEDFWTREDEGGLVAGLTEKFDLEEVPVKDSAGLRWFRLRPAGPHASPSR